jgi:hypothetical protein
MTRRSLLLTPEVCAWLTALADEDFGRVACYLDLLCERGGRLAEPHSRALRGRLRQLEVPGRRRPRRLTYYLPGRGSCRGAANRLASVAPPTPRA